MRSSTYDLTNPDYIASNRFGRLTPEQMSALKNMYLWPSVFGLGLVGFFGCSMLAVFGAVALSQAVSSRGNNNVMWLIGLALLFGVGIFAVAIAPGSLGSLWTWSRLSGRATAVAEGRLGWRGGAYRGVVEGATLNLPKSVELAPGAYRFFYVPEARLIVSAEKLQLTLSADEGRAEVLRALQDVFHFNADDLGLNQALKLSFNQRLRVLLAAANGVLVSFGVLALFAVVLAAYVWLSGGLSALTGLRAIILPVVSVVYVVALIVVTVGNLLRALEAFVGKVATTSGNLIEAVEIVRSGRNSTKHVYSYVIGGMKFRVSQAAHQASIENQPYRAFYLARSGRILSMEPLSGDAGMGAVSMPASAAGTF